MPHDWEDQSLFRQDDLEFDAKGPDGGLYKFSIGMDIAIDVDSIRKCLVCGQESIDHLEVEDCYLNMCRQIIEDIIES